MTPSPLYDVVCVGNYTKDTILRPSGVQYVDGGGMNYAARATQRLGYRTAVVTRLAREDERVVQALQSHGIDCFVTYTPSSTLMRLEYPTEDPDIRTLSVAETAGAITAEQVRPVSARAAIIGSSFRGEVGLDVLRLLRERGMMVAADMQGFVRVHTGGTLLYQPWPEMAETLALVDIVKTDAVEAEFLTGETDIERAARNLAAYGPGEIVLTHRDGLLVFAGGQMHHYRFYSARLDGRGGRGDTCVGTYVASRLTRDPSEAGVWAAAVTSLKMERLGPFDRPLADVEALIAERYATRA